MELIVKPEGTDLIYQAFFQEPIVDHLTGNNLISTTVNMAKAFGLRLNSIKLNNETPSDNFIHFYVFMGGGNSFEVSFGLEEVSARLIRPLNEKQVVDLYSKLWQFLENLPITIQKMSIQQQMSSEGDIPVFLETLSPRVSATLEKLVNKRGVYFGLGVSEHNLNIDVTVVPSILQDDWLFFSIDNNFSPSTYDFPRAFKIVKEYRELILKELKLTIRMET